MRQIFTVFFLLLATSITTHSYSQIIFSEDFQNGMPAGFTLLDVDGKTPDAATAYVGGTWNIRENFDVPGDSVAVSNSWFTPVGCCADDWMITSAITLTSNNFLRWEAKSQDALYLEAYEVRIGTSPNTTALNTVLWSTTAEDSNWTSHQIDLDAAGWANQTVYIAFRNVSNDKFLLLVDDIEVEAINVSSCVDTVTYTLQKGVGVDFLSLNNQTSAHEVAQYFDCPQSITVSGFEFHAFKTNTNGGTSINVTCALYLAGTDSMPTGSALAVATVAVDTNFYGGLISPMLKSAVFNSPVTVNAPYCLVIINNTANAVGIVCSDNTNAPPDGLGEWLSSAKIGSNWLRGYDITFNSLDFDADFLFYPYCSYTNSAAFTPTTVSSYPNYPIGFVNQSSPILFNRMYNFAWYLGVGDLSFHWNYGDGTWGNAVNTSHGYSNTGTFTVTLQDTLYGWTADCIDDTTGQVTISTPPVNLCGPDTVTYTLQKATAFTTIAVNNATSGHAESQYFDCPQAVTVYGFDFYAYKEDDTAGIATTVDCHIYLAGSDSMPTGNPLATVTVYLDTNFYGGTLADLRKSAIFASPVTMTQPYCLVLENNSPVSIGFVVNDYTATIPDGGQEWLSSVLIGSSWLRGYNVNVGGFTFDADMMFYPIVSYTLQSNFSPLSTTGAPGNTINWANLSSPIFGNKMYNFLAYLGQTNDSYSWNYGDGSAIANVQNGSNTYSSNGNYTVTLTDTLLGWTRTCVADTQGTVVISSCNAPVAAFTYGTSGLTATFSDGSSNAPTSWLWNFGDGNSSTQQNPSHTYASGGTYTVCLTATNACSSNTVCNTVSVSCALPVTNWSNSNNNLVVTFTDLTTNSPTSFLWDFGNGNTSTQQNPTHTYSSTGTYTVCLTTTNSCGTDSACGTVVVSCPAPGVNFTSSVSGLVVSFTDASSGSPSSFLWDFGDGNTSTQQNPTHTYASTGNYTVCLTATNTCGTDSSCSSVNLTCPLPSANFTSSVSGATASFTDGSTNNPTSWAWTFGDGNTSTQQNPSHTYASSGTYTVCVTSTNTCGSDSSCKSVTISCTAPVVGFTNSSGSLTVNFTDQTTGSPTGWSWTFGDGNSSSSQNPTNTYSSAGTYTVCLSATNACSTVTSCSTVVVTCSAPQPTFTNTTGALAVTFTDQTTGSPTSWAWTFGDGNTSTLQNPTNNYTSPGTYTVCLTVTDACTTGTGCQTITVTCSAPTAAFTSSSSGLAATFTDVSTGSPTAWAWTFGDGNTSSLQSPVHNYSAPGTYTVCMTISSVCGSDTICNPVTVTCVPSVAAFSSSINALTVNFTDATNGNPSTWSWDFGDGNSSTNQNPSHTYTSPGTYNVCLTVNDSCGSDTTCQQITVNCPAPVASFSFNATGGTVAFTDNSTNTPTSWQWNFGDGNSSTNQNPSHTYSANGNYSVCLTATSNCGSDSTCQTVNVTLIGIESVIFEEIELFPNPTAGNLVLKANFLGNSDVEIKILDAQGRLVIPIRTTSGKLLEERFDVSNLSGGTYYMEISADDQKVIKRFVRQ